MAKKSIYQIKVTPPIWRRLLISSDTRLDELHDIIQIAMGWEDYHLHQFTKDAKDGFTKYYGVPEPDFGFAEVLDESKFKISQLLTKEKDKIGYCYDFGDSWHHDIVLEKILDFDKNQRLPMCIKGRRACPFEDCGGIGGYEYMLEVLNDKTHPEYQDMREWLELEGDEIFDPAFVDIDDINESLA